jgi:hypothetical protein
MKRQDIVEGKKESPIDWTPLRSKKTKIVNSDRGLVFFRKPLPLIRNLKARKKMKGVGRNLG